MVNQSFILTRWEKKQDLTSSLVFDISPQIPHPNKWKVCLCSSNSLLATNNDCWSIVSISQPPIVRKNLFNIEDNKTELISHSDMLNWPNLWTSFIYLCSNFSWIRFLKVWLDNIWRSWSYCRNGDYKNGLIEIKKKMKREEQFSNRWTAIIIVLLL